MNLPINLHILAIFVAAIVHGNVVRNADPRVKTRTYILRPTHNRNGGSSQPRREPREIAEPVVDSLHAVTHVHSRFASTLVSSRVKNVRDATAEVHFTLDLPENAFITNFTMLINGEVVVGEVKEKEEAKREYEQARDAGQSAGLIAQSPRDSNTFRTSVSVEAMSKVTFNVTYQEILQREHGRYRQQFNIALPHPVARLRVEVHIEEERRIVDYAVPRVANDTAKQHNKLLIGAEPSSIAVVDASKIGEEHSILTVVYAPDVIQQKALSKDDTIGAQLVVLYDVERSADGGQVQVVDGYFVHFFAPSALDVAAKRLVFVVDTSGSMSGVKMEQTKVALETMLGELRDGDEFVIVEFDDGVRAWREEFSAVSKDNVAKAVDYVNTLKADGSTNIDGALRRAIELVSGAVNVNDMVPLIVFMTDGQATAGETNSDVMIENVRNYTSASPMAIHTLAFGRGADYSLMRRVSRATNGLSRKIYEDSDADIQMEGFYALIGSPLLSKLDIAYLNGTVDEGSVVLERGINYYEGGEVMVVGRLLEGVAEGGILAEIRGRGAHRGYQWTCVLPHPILPLPSPITPANTYGGYVERMWAYRTIKKLLDDHEFGDGSKEEKEEAKEKALQLSLKYNFVTSLTSMVVTQSNSTTAITDEEIPQFGHGGMVMKNMHHSYAMPAASSHMAARKASYRRPSHALGMGGPRGASSQTEADQDMPDTGSFTPPLTCGRQEEGEDCVTSCLTPELQCGGGVTNATKEDCEEECRNMTTTVCRCVEGLSRNSTGECIDPVLCPNYDCPPNEIVAVCGNLCEPKCGDGPLSKCPKMCAPPACVCVEGHNRQSDGECGICEGDDQPHNNTMYFF